jgi:hypothetical protein
MVKKRGQKNSSLGSKIKSFFKHKYVFSIIILILLAGSLVLINNFQDSEEAIAGEAIRKAMRTKSIDPLKLPINYDLSKLSKKNIKFKPAITPYQESLYAFFHAVNGLDSKVITLQPTAVSHLKFKLRSQYLYLDLFHAELMKKGIFNKYAKVANSVRKEIEETGSVSKSNLNNYIKVYNEIYNLLGYNQEDVEVNLRNELIDEALKQNGGTFFKGETEADQDGNVNGKGYTLDEYNEEMILKPLSPFTWREVLEGIKNDILFEVEIENDEALEEKPDTGFSGPKGGPSSGGAGGSMGCMNSKTGFGPSGSGSGNGLGVVGSTLGEGGIGGGDPVDPNFDNGAAGFGGGYSWLMCLGMGGGEVGSPTGAMITGADTAEGPVGDSSGESSTPKGEPFDISAGEAFNRDKPKSGTEKWLESGVSKGTDTEKNKAESDAQWRKDTGDIKDTIVSYGGQFKFDPVDGAGNLPCWSSLSGYAGAASGCSGCGGSNTITDKVAPFASVGMTTSPGMPAGDGGSSGGGCGGLNPAMVEKCLGAKDCGQYDPSPQDLVTNIVTGVLVTQDTFDKALASDTLTNIGMKASLD